MNLLILFFTISIISSNPNIRINVESCQSLSVNIIKSDINSKVILEKQITQGIWKKLVSKNLSIQEGKIIFTNLNPGYYRANVIGGKSLSNKILYSKVLRLSCNLDENIKANIHPNPSSNFITVNLGEFEKEFQMLNIYNVRGQLIKSSINNEADIKDIVSGVYFVEIILTNDRIVKKLFKID